MNIEKKLKKLNLELTSSPDNTKIKNDYQIILTAFRLKKAREKAGFTSAPQAYLFHGWGKLPYTQHESGTKSLDHDSVQKYARAYGVTPDWLLTGKGLGTSTRMFQSSSNKSFYYYDDLTLFYKYVYSRRLGQFGSNYRFDLQNTFYRLNMQFQVAGVSRIRLLKGHDLITRIAYLINSGFVIEVFYCGYFTKFIHVGNLYSQIQTILRLPDKYIHQHESTRLVSSYFIFHNNGQIMRYLPAAIILFPLLSYTMMIRSVEAQGNYGCFISLSNAETERGIRHYRSDCKDWYTKIEKLRDYQLDPQEVPWVNVAVVSVDKRSGRLTVSHGPIPEVGLPAMTIHAFTSNNIDLATLHPGDRIEVQCEHSAGSIRILNWRNL